VHRIITLIAVLAVAPAAYAAKNPTVAPDPVVWVGEEFEGQRLDRVLRQSTDRGRRVDFLYGDNGLSIQNVSLCTRHPLEIDLIPDTITQVRGVPLIEYAPDRVEVLTGRTNAVVWGFDEGLNHRAAEALRLRTTGDQALPPPRLPRWVLSELRLVRDEQRRLGDTPELRRRLGIGKEAIKLRLDLLAVLPENALDGVRASRSTPRQNLRDRGAFNEAKEIGPGNRAQRRRAARHRARIERC
jgi:hypothetical protein